ncbi:MAG: DUF5685 family protein [Lachnospiraceae bacterium]|jgi:hypothetical protein|nr:DUF5685 family protein [Lachnospiraceae bacterium]
MFGYVRTDKNELKVRDYETYNAYYCGICRELKEAFGIKGQMTLGYDMVFLSVLLTGLYEPEEERHEGRCMVHPLHRHVSLTNAFTRYCAYMNVLLSYCKCLDDVRDEASKKAAVFSRLLRKSARIAGRAYPRQKKAIVKELKALYELEKKNSGNIDEVAGCFGRLIAGVFVFRHDEWEKYLSRMGFYLGKFIYIADALCDLDEDKKNGRYNPFADSCITEDEKQKLLGMMAAECTDAYEMLPIVKNKAIIDNILYSGIFLYATNEKKDKGNSAKGYKG